MAQLLNIQTFGNQKIEFSINSQTFSFYFYWNGQLNRYFVEITNLSNSAVVDSQSIEPFSNLNIYNLNMGDIYIIPILNPITYNNDNGSMVYNFSDLSGNLKIGVFTSDEVQSINDNYGVVTLL